jgi:S1-C subfamily serine protease
VTKGLTSLDIIVERTVDESAPASADPPVTATGAAPSPSAPRAPRKWLGRHRRAFLVASVAAVLIATLARALGDDTEPVEPLDRAAVDRLVDERVTEALEATQRAPARSAEVYRTILPSIVVIRATRAGATPSDADDGSLGTGVVVNADGSIMTAAHVIDGATEIRVRFADGTESPATITSADRDNDTAVLLPTTLPQVVVPATLGGGVRVGDETFAVGHPLGLVGSLSAGVISGLERSIPREDGGRLTGLIQFDAAVNPGNSGGPLLDRAGRVVGIVTAIADPSQDGSFIGIGFAVPIATAGGAAGAPPR